MKKYWIMAACAALCTSCGSSPEKKEIATSDSVAAAQPVSSVHTSSGQTILLPPPFETKSAVHFCDVIGWKDGETPVAPAGFTVTKYAEGMKNPRWIYELPNGDVLVACANTESKSLGKKIKNVVSGKTKADHTTSSENAIIRFHGLNAGGGAADGDVFLEDIHLPFGMLLLNSYLYVAYTSGVMRYPYTSGQTRITDSGQKIISLPEGGYNNHWTRNIIASPDGKKIYVSVGSGSNAAEHGMENEIRRANIIEFNPDGTGERIYASGLRNPVGMAWAPGTNTLWTAVNERDELGDGLVPDYFTSVKDGGFYGWPYCYYGQHPDPRIPAKEQRPDLVKHALIPDVALGCHTASLGLGFYTKDAFPARYKNGAFIGQHGSWNKSSLAGYKVVFVPFANGRPSGPPEDFLTGFIVNDRGDKVHGRPVGICVLHDGSMLVADDASNTIWRIVYK